MKEASLEVLDDGRIELSGVLDFSTVGMVLERGLELFEGHTDLLLDLGRVTRANSAGLALLTEWLDHAQRRGVRIRLINLPPSLEAIARMSNLYALLPLRTGDP